jgi:outer membrane biosynthesis protein TonB
MSGEGDRFVDTWRLGDAPETSGSTSGSGTQDEEMERALLAYAQQSAARVGAEWFAAEFARREELERLELEVAERRHPIVDAPGLRSVPEIALVDASVEDQVVGGAPTSLGIAPPPPEQEPDPDPDPEPEPQPPLDPEPPLKPEPPLEPEPPLVPKPPLEPEPEPPPVMRHPHVPRPPSPEPAYESKRRRRRKTVQVPTPQFVISAPEWARMSPGARRLYGVDAAPPAAGIG